MRSFIAINPDDDVRAGLEEVSNQLRERGWPVRWVPTENIHLTLKFLGDVPDGLVPQLTTALDHVGSEAEPLELSIGGFGVFPSPERPRVLWIGADGGPALGALQAAIESAVVALGFEPESRDFHPHFTLGRAKKRARPSNFGGLEELVEELDYSDRLPVSSIELMKSELGPDGASYEVVHSSRLSEG